MLYLFSELILSVLQAALSLTKSKWIEKTIYYLSMFCKLKSLCALVQHSFKLFFHVNSFFFISILNKTPKVRFLIFSEIISCIYNLQSPYKTDYNMYNRSSCNFLLFLKIHLMQRVIVNTQYTKTVQTG